LCEFNKYLKRILFLRQMVYYLCVRRPQTLLGKSAEIGQKLNYVYRANLTNEREYISQYHTLTNDFAELQTWLLG
jgi:hypothetical protein